MTSLVVQKENLPANASDTGSIPGAGRFQCLGNWLPAPQLLKPEHTEPALRNKKTHCNEKPYPPQLQKAHMQ